MRDENIADTGYDVFVSLVTRHDSEIVTVPQFVLELQRPGVVLVEPQPEQAPKPR